MRPIRVLLLFACMYATPLAAQAIDIAKTTISVAGGLQLGTSLWDVPNQSILSSNQQLPPAAGLYAPDLFHLIRSVPAGVTISASATHFTSRHFGLRFELTYLGLKAKASCQVAHDGGDPELATACAFVGSSEKFGGGISIADLKYHDPTGSDQSGSAVLLQAGIVLRPFKPAPLQPYFNLMAGFAETPHSTVALESTYGTDRSDCGSCASALALTIYQDYHWAQSRPVFTAATGITGQAVSGLLFRAEIRETFLAQSIVTGPTSTQGQEPPNRSALKAIPSLMFGLDLVLKRERGKRY